MIKNSLVKTLAQKFNQNGYELYLVGGAIRDILLNKNPEEYDFTTNAKPEEIKKIINKTNPNILYTIGEKFGTIGAIYDQTKVEITTYRSEVYTPGNRHPEVNFGTTLQGDLSRRDFTINAIAYDPLKNTYIDPFNGQSDIKNQLIKVVGDSVNRFQEDPLRILRAIRFASTLNFKIEPETYSYLKKTATNLSTISAERISQELDKILLSQKPSQAFRVMTDTGILNFILPEFMILKDVEHETYKHKNIYEHTLQVIDNVKPTKKLRWLAVLHDIAKPQTKKFEKGKINFIGHEMLGSKLARQILKRLNYDKKFIDEVSSLVKLHLRVNLYSSDWADSAIRRLSLEVGDLMEDLIEFSYADITSAKQYKLDQGYKRISEFKYRLEEIKKQSELDKIKSPLSGEDLMIIFNQPPGPWIKPIKDRLLDLVIEGELSQNDKETAIKIAKQIYGR